jgi:hypothetical protein
MRRAENPGSTEDLATDWALVGSDVYSRDRRVQEEMMDTRFAGPLPPPEILEGY